MVQTYLSKEQFFPEPVLFLNTALVAASKKHLKVLPEILLYSFIKTTENLLYRLLVNLLEYHYMPLCVVFAEAIFLPIFSFFCCFDFAGVLRFITILYYYH